MIPLPIADIFGIPPQTFQALDVMSILLLILLEGLLSADNALVMAIMVRHLPEKQRSKALLYGLGGAFVFRAIALVMASYILGLWWLQLAGALYLIFLTLKHFLKKDHGDDEVKSRAGTGFWMTVLLVEFTDIAFAVDSVLAAVGFIKGPEKLWIAYAGAMIGVILLRYAAQFFIKLLDRMPFLEHMAYALIGWVGVKLLLLSGHSLDKWLPKSNSTFRLPFHVEEMSQLVFWIGMAIILSVGTLLAIKFQQKVDESESTEPVEIEFENEENLEIK
ncbi:MAG: TerC family protein [Armatimonadetes bacterium]|nr:TerC family protein [Armatimonadota bacterium]